MANPIVNLTALTLISPSVPGSDLSIDSSVLPFIVDADTNTTRVEVLIYNQVFAFTTFTLVNGKNRFLGSVAIQASLDPVLVQILGRNYDPNNILLGQHLYITPTLKFNLIKADSSLALTIGPPSGLRNYKGKSSSRVEWVTPIYGGFIGVRLSLSTDESGVTVPYVQFGDLVTAIERSDNVVITSDSTTQVSGNTTTITTVQQTSPANFSAVDVAPTDVNNVSEFFAVVTTVVQDPVSNVVFESKENGPLTCGFVDLKKVAPTDFLALQRKEDIAARMIAGITRLYPDLDLTPRSELRDLLIDPAALEMSNMSVREWFARCSQSISAIATLDDLNDDGISDTLDTNQMKQQVARAFGLSATDTQVLIDKQFDILGEQAGIIRGGATASVTELTFYTFTKPLQRVTIPLGATVATIPDAETPALNFVTRGSAVIDPTNVDSFYNPAAGWWGVTVPAECSQTGSIGNVGAGAIRQVVSSVPSLFNVQNLVAADFGTDSQSNSKYAEQIQDRLVTGVDSGTRAGYLVAARGTPGVVDARVVAAGDGEMLRDWFAAGNKHVFGCVDIYTRGTNFGQQSENVTFTYENTSNEGDFPNYITASLIDRNLLKFQINGFSALAFPIYTTVELRVQRGNNSFYLATKNAQFDNSRGVITLDPTEIAFSLVGDAITQAPTPLLINNVPATNAVAVASLAGAQSSYSFQVFARYQSGIIHSPALQPVLGVFSVTGETGETGAVDPSAIRLVHSTDFLLDGGSNRANDVVAVDSNIDTLKTLTLTFATSGPTTLAIDTGMDVPLDGNGKPLGLVSVRLGDLSTLYNFGVDYTIVGTDRYHTYGIRRLTDATVPNFQGIPLDQPIVVAYNKFTLIERMSFASEEAVTVNGSLPTQLANFGFIRNVWQPESFSDTTLSYDGAVYAADGSVDVVNSTGLCGALVPHAQRYIKVTQNNGSSDVIMREGVDFTLTVDVVSGAATVARIITGKIADGATLKVSYFFNEEFTIVSEYPAFVEQLATQIESSKHAAADVLVKAMIANPIDVTLAVTLDPSATPEVIDLQIRSVISIALDNAKGTMTQAELIRQVKSVNGVTNVGIPLGKFAKSDGAYDIGIVVPTQTPWIPVSTVPAFQGHTWGSNCFITTFPVLPDSTIPSGGLKDSFVGLLQEGTAYTRANSVLDFQSKSAGTAFYIIGVNDQVDPSTPLDATFEDRVMISLPVQVTNPGVSAYRVTYQVFAEGGAKDIVISSTEYLKAGRISISYIT